MAQGTVLDFDDAAGFGTVRLDAEGDGAAEGALLPDEPPTDGQPRTYFFHCTAIADGSRHIEVGAPVRFDVVAGRLGRWEGSGLEPC